MTSSRSSKDCDPLSDALLVLGASSMRRTKLVARGEWALSFPGLARLKFVAVLDGRCWITLPDVPPQPLRAGDTFVLSNRAYVVASDPAITPTDGAALFKNTDEVLLGREGGETVAVGGGLEFESDAARFLADTLFPPFMFLPARSPMAGVVATTLALLDDEMSQARLGGSLMTARLADILLMQVLRACISEPEAAHAAWIGALADAQIGHALRLMHQDLARPWTVEALASAVGMSRSALASRFRHLVGKPPLNYLRHWRMLLARNALRHEQTSVGSLAARFGYESESAFTHAYKRTFGHSPRRDARQVGAL
ncbi:AraC family transcriptional regulator [Xanthobacteraceae bacterium Astr-EGSB]|uniref:AraC family transcriptional regulator n=1 Tax=Astrobacterium formosum TaxID=3069710 RepID=UPI0027B1D156|nr:AraC family transcriptional regulator [Xanthobacteraceae bacterium Astr-EGSB]